MNKLYLIGYGIVCTAVGAVGTYFIMKNNFEKELDNRIESLKNVFEKNGKTCAELLVEETEELLAEADDIEEKNSEDHDKYVKYASAYSGSKDIEYPTRESFENFEEYDKITYVYYQDDVLCDERDEPVAEEEINGVVGDDFLIHFGENEKDVCLVLNHRLKMAIEIVEDPQYYYKDRIGRRRRGSEDDEE